MRFLLIAFLLLLELCASGLAQSAEFNLPELQRAYASNNQDQLPTVSLMRGGTPLFLLYPDGRLLVGNPQTKRPGFALLSESQLNEALAQISSIEGFWNLAENFALTPASDQPEHVLTIRIHGKPTKAVSVYGNLDAPLPNSPPPPATFTTLVRLLTKLTPQKLRPWDPGYVEIFWADFGYAREPSASWPKDWPHLSSALTRKTKDDDLIKYFMVFPSSRVADLDQFLAGQRERGAAILIDDWKSSANYRWPLPNEKKWSSWTQ